MSTSPGWTETMTEVADFPSPDCALGLRYLADRMGMFLELRIDSARHWKSSSGSKGNRGLFFFFFFLFFFFFFLFFFF